MAQLVLGVAGAAIGSFAGPLGAQIGWAVGSMLGNLLDPQKVEGPRLSDLKLQASQYGQMIPFVWAKVRLAGQVIDQSDLVEHSETSDGKGGPEVTTYSYTASWAVLLCEGPIVAITRIWADGRLVYDATTYSEGIEFPFTEYLGTETQEPDPTLEALRGAGNVPAYRGRAYVVFTDMPLGDYANRLPNLSFEVVTIEPSNTGLRLVAFEQGDTSAPEWEWGTSFMGGPYGEGPPQITSWPNDTDEQIVVRNMRQSGGHDYNNPDLTYSGSTGDPGEAPTSQEVMGPEPTATWDYFAIGQIYVGGDLLPLYFHGGFAITAGQQNIPLAVGPVWSIDGVNTTTDRNIAEELGLVAGRWIGAIAISQDHKTFIVLTSPTSGLIVDTWHKFVDGSEVETGDIDPPINSSGNNNLGYGNWSDSDGYFHVAMLENNGEWWWRYTELTGGGTFTVYNIDPVTRNFALNAVCGTLIVSVTYLGGPAMSFARPAIYVMKEGYCGLVKANIIAVVSRFPIFDARLPVSEVVADLSDRAGLDVAEYDVEDLEEDYIDGFAISNQAQVRAPIDQLRAGFFFDAVESGTLVKFVKRGGDSVVTVPDDDLSAHVPGGEVPPLMTTTRIQEVELPRIVNVNYLNKDADYQSGTEPSERQVTSSDLRQTVDLAIVMTPNKAKQVAENILFNGWMEREKFAIAVSRKYIDLEPTDVIVARSRTMRIVEKEEDASGIIRLQGVATHPKLWLAAPLGSEALGFTPQQIPVDQDTEVALLDIPLINDADEELGFYAAMSGRKSSRWRGAALFKSTDGGTNYTLLDSQSTANAMGKATTALGDYLGGNFFDEGNSVTVYLTGGSPALSSASALDVLNGANTAVIGNEVVKFKTATLVSDRTYTLSGFLRGRKGTEWATGLHTVGDPFVLLPATDYDIDVSEVNVPRHYKAVTIGRTLAQTEVMPFTVFAIRAKPYAPVHLGGGVNASGDVLLNWTRRTRLGGAWRDGAEVMLGEGAESYVVQIWDETYTDVARVITGVTSPAYTYTSAMQVTDFGATQQTVYFTVGQLGAQGLGYETRGTAVGAGVDDDAVLVPIPPYQGVPPPVGGSEEADHFENWRTLYDAGGRDRELAYFYTRLNSDTISWYQANQNDIIAYIGSSYGWALWVQAGDTAGPLTSAEHADLIDLADGAG